MSALGSPTRLLVCWEVEHEPSNDHRPLDRCPRRIDSCAPNPTGMQSLASPGIERCQQLRLMPRLPQKCSRKIRFERPTNCDTHGAESFATRPTRPSPIIIDPSSSMVRVREPGSLPKSRPRLQLLKRHVWNSRRCHPAFPTLLLPIEGLWGIQPTPQKRSDFASSL